MLTTERHQLILALLKEQGTIKLQDLVEQLQASESTIRRDLVQLEEMKALKRVHGGAALLKQKGIEPSLNEKRYANHLEKQQIGRLAASYIDNDDCVYLDAGTTVFEMIPFIKEKNVTVLTNGLMHIPLLMEADIKTFLVGGKLKVATNAIVGSQAVQFLSDYRFDKCFLGMNGIHPDYGLTTPDPDEALLKMRAIQLSNKSYVLADSSKLYETTFAKVAAIEEATIITDVNDEEAVLSLQKHSNVKVVTT
ncbi:DeoR/GlpR family DNA-binding transcription regulator [Bacillus cihuensis]|uniref:DeoR/GlpR family DNA-binding transcription regulator n=1 Tax=Bacillus cihuensis TaxID=1208599 RepID=UPI0003FE27E4|nr:DeoR/GlpR family DNA-binding transcription regulator [Bacillus cihuensis]